MNNSGCGQCLFENGCRHLLKAVTQEVSPSSPSSSSWSSSMENGPTLSFRFHMWQSDKQKLHYFVSFLTRYKRCYLCTHFNHSVKLLQNFFFSSSYRRYISFGYSGYYCILSILVSVNPFLVASAQYLKEPKQNLDLGCSVIRRISFSNNTLLPSPFITPLNYWSPLILPPKLCVKLLQPLWGTKTGMMNYVSSQQRPMIVCLH